MTKPFSFLFYPAVLVLFFMALAANAQENLPDLVLESATFTPTQLSFTVSNVGNATVAQSRVCIQWLRSDRTPIEPNCANTPFQPGTSLTITPGSHSTINYRTETPSVLNDYLFNTPPTDGVFLRLTADYDNRVGEGDETNNQVEVLLITSQTTGEDLAIADEEQVVQEIEQELHEAAELIEVSDGGDPDREIQPGSVSNPETSFPETGDNQTQSVKRTRFAPKILPGNPLYLFKTLNREVRAMFTLDPVKDMGLRLRFASEKILEANILADQGKTERAAEHITSYSSELEKLNQFIVNLEKENKDIAEKLLEKSATSELKHQILIGKIEKVTPSDKLSELKDAQSKVLETLTTTINRLDSKRAEKVVSNALNSNGSPFRQLRNLEVLKVIEKKVPGKAKNAIQKAQKNAIKRFADQLDALPEKHQVLISEYIEESGGDELGYLESLSEIEAFNPDIADEILEAEEELLEDIYERIEESDEQEEEFINNLDIVVKNDKNLESIIKKVRPEVIKKVSDKLNEFEKIKTGEIKQQPVSEKSEVEKSEIDELRAQCSDRLESLQKDVVRVYEELFGSRSQISPRRLLAAFPTINQNTDALNAQINLEATNQRLAESMERLSSGLRTNRASEDAAGLAERFDKQVRVINQAVLNLKVGTSDACDKEVSEMRSILGELKTSYKKPVTKTLSPTPTKSAAPTSTPIIKTTSTPTPVPTKLITPTPIPTKTVSPTPTPASIIKETATPTPIPTKTVSPTSTPVIKESPTPTPTPTKEPTPTPTPTSSPTPTPVTISKPVMSSFIVSPTVIAPKQSVTLSWETSGADSVILSNTKETLTSSGKKIVYPTATTTYTITATNKGGSTSASVTVTVK